MSKYTTEVRFICESYAGYNESEGYDKINEIIENSRRNIFGDYPIFDEAYRGVLETKILKHYYTREISEETVGLWKLRLNSRMNEIMPYFNKLYDSELIKFNPLHDVDLTREYTKNNEENTEGGSTQEYSGNSSGSDTTETESGTDSTGTVTSSGWNKFNDTPQGGLNGLAADEYMSAATKIESTENSTSSTDSTSNGTREYESADSNTTENAYNGKVEGMEDYIEHITGTNGGISYSKRLKEFRETFLNIDLQIIDNLKNLFFYLW